jgi:hypothetical protein
MKTRQVVAPILAMWLLVSSSRATTDCTLTVGGLAGGFEILNAGAISMEIELFVGKIV